MRSTMFNAARDVVALATVNPDRIQDWAGALENLNTCELIKNVLI
jgi:hypothetical protein